MPRPIIGLDERKDDIERWIVHDGVKIIDVVARLKNDYNINIQKRTLERNLQAWGLTTRSRMSKAALQQELTRLFRGPHMTDQEICKSLNDQGHVINPRTVMDTRKRMGLHKRIRHDTKEEDLQATIRQLLQVEYQDEAVLKMERSELYTYLKTKYPEHHITGR
jgi:transposase